MGASSDRNGRSPVRDVLAHSVLLTVFLGSLGLNALLLAYLPLHGLAYYIAFGTLSAAETAMGIRITVHCSAPVRELLREMLEKRP